MRYTDGSIQSIYEKTLERDFLVAAGNRLAVYVDNGDAWEIPIQYKERAPEYFSLVSTQASVHGAQAINEHIYQYGNSILRQRVILTAGSRRLDFVTEVDWRESARMLRTSFPTGIPADDATCDIQLAPLSVRHIATRLGIWRNTKFRLKNGLIYRSLITGQHC